MLSGLEEPRAHHEPKNEGICEKLDLKPAYRDQSSMMVHNQLQIARQVPLLPHGNGPFLSHRAFLLPQDIQGHRSLHSSLEGKLLVTPWMNSHWAETCCRLCSLEQVPTIPVPPAYGPL